MYGTQLLTNRKQTDEMLFQIKDLSLTLYGQGKPARILNNIDLYIRESEVVGLIGETGSGKSLTALTALRLLPPSISASVEGEVFFEGRDLLQEDEDYLRTIRGSRICIIFQDPMSYLNPVLTVGRQLVDVILAHNLLGESSRRFPLYKGDLRKKATAHALQILKDVGIPRQEVILRSYPHELSGGMGQRVLIAMALLCNPRLIIADEPTASLDVTLQVQILKLLKQRVQERKTALLLISHDLGIIRSLCHRVYVMYAGEIVESGDVETVIHKPAHPYTQKLINAIPSRELDKRLTGIEGTVCDFTEPPPGCRFEPRCSSRMLVCKLEKPILIEFEPNHQVSCFLYENRNHLE
ncbi:MAG TPA: ABC transporter ATP-binding protein [Candidatus Limnocylindrales bacterium]|nr:ABC transporter ATP-binding protein [Candidatus Limnocylindrales bacterium]